MLQIAAGPSRLNSSLSDNALPKPISLELPPFDAFNGENERNKAADDGEGVTGAAAVDGPLEGKDGASALAVCPNSPFRSSNTGFDCKIQVRFPNGQDIGCSAFIVTPRHVATSGRCLYDRARGGYIRFLNLYCTGSNVCGNFPSSSGAGIIVPTRWVSASNTNGSALSPYDGGMVLLRDDVSRFGIRRVAEAPPCTGTNAGFSVSYPSAGGGTGCSSFNGCLQNQANGRISCTAPNGLYSTTTSGCGSSAGGAVFDSSVQATTGWVNGYQSTPRCRTFATPQRTRANSDGGCNGRRGGVSLGCLLDFLPA